MATANPPAFHCIVCTLTKIPFASLSKESQHKIVRNGRPTPKMPNLTARCLHDWMTGCDREKKLYCWPCLLFNTSEYDVWGKRGFSDFHRLSSATIEHTKDVSHQAKSKTLKLWIETAEELSDSSGAEEDVECIPELDFLNATASEMDEELDVKPNVEALNAALGLSQDFARPVVDLCETAEDGGSVTGFHFMSAAIEVDCMEDEEQNSAPAPPQPPPPPEVQGENSQTSNASSSNHIEPSVAAPGDGLARIYKNTPSCEEPSAMMSQTATQNGTDKYQLKWQGHHQNVNVSLSSLYRNDRYADVMLLTCNGDENYVIPAHKLILGTSSLYFANIFDKNAIPMNAISYIVLPPDLTYRSMQILIQYMYTGESTVSTDILSEVLRGGEILKIRGLWRNDGCKPSSNAEGREAQAPGSSESAARRFASPVSVTLPSQNTSTTQAATGGVPAVAVGHINIKRDVAIDPGDRHRAGHTEGLRRSQRNQASAVGPCTEQQQSSSQAISDEQQISFPIHEHQRRLRGGAQEQQRMETASPTRMTLPKAGNGGTEENSASSMSGAPAAIPEELNFLNVKAEPVEWTDVRAGELALPSSGQKGAGNQSPPIQAVKAEAPEPGIESRPSSVTSSTEHPTYSPLTCELCSETFTIPGEWVRHIESHGDTSHTIPKRKRRLEGSDDTVETAALRCDLCATFYVTPADWVRHVQSAHTETELAISNKRQTNPRRASTCSSAAASSVTSGESAGQQDKVCKVCNKSFPSHASMLVHKRTHTGEKPFYCDTCNKGFSVKSNLLRHLRTLHNVQGELPASPHTDHDGSE